MGEKEMRTILVTGAAGFIGFHLSRRLLEKGDIVIGIDNLNPYYSVKLKQARLKLLEEKSNFRFYPVDIEDRQALEGLFMEERPTLVINLAAQVGVRYSLTNPHAYVGSNLVGFMNILESCRHHQVKHLIFASSSSVYGANTGIPFSVHDRADHPLSIYAATKKSNELMAHTYAALYGLPCTGVRFFTVYGPWGRPDMAYFLFTRAILEGRPIDIYNNGQMKRDFTYIDDVVEGIVRIAQKIPLPNPHWNGDNPDPATSFAPYRVYNIGNNNPVPLMEFIEILEEHLGRKAQKKLLPLQSGDVLTTFADVDDLVTDLGFRPMTSLAEGIKSFIAWYRDYYSC